jgi:hypothetical protein
MCGYLSWRDTKAAIVMFNRNTDFSRVIAAIVELRRAIPPKSADQGNRAKCDSNMCLPTQLMPIRN